MSVKYDEPHVVVGLSSAEPSGLWIDRELQELVRPAPKLTFRDTRWPATPGNVATAFCPGTVVVNVTGAPPGTMVAAASAGTLWRISVAVPVSVPDGSNAI